MARTFTLNDAEEEKASEFIKNHECGKKYVGAIGGHFSYEFVVTSIGIGANVKCNVCNHVENVTDYGDW